MIKLESIISNNLQMKYSYINDNLLMSSISFDKDKSVDDRLLITPFSLMIAGKNDGYMPSHSTSFGEQGYKMSLKSKKITCESATLIYENKDHNIEVECHYVFYKNTDVIRQYNKIINNSNENITLTHFSSALINGIGEDGNLDVFDENKFRVHYFRQTWEGEGQHRESNFEQLGLIRTSVHQTPNCIDFSSIGSWSTKKLLPLVFIEDLECNKIWYLQNEASTNWQIQLGVKSDEGYKKSSVFIESNNLSERNGGQIKVLKPKESYTTFNVGFGCTNGGMNEAIKEITKYRRQISSVKKSNPIVFNDYMNCLWGNPTKDRLLLLIDKATEIGAELFCIDAGWFGDKIENWGTYLGDWYPCEKRFGDLKLLGIIDYIKEKGMRAGIWLEIECAAVNANICNKPDYWFLTRNRERIISGGRMFLDMSNQEVISYLNKCIDRLINMGITYFKNDYNECLSLGSDLGDSFGDGLERNTKAVYDFFIKLKARYPDLIIENCASGAMRQDYGIMSIFDLQSISDQEIYTKNPSIITGAIASLLPEQSGVWAYPYPLHFGDIGNEAVFMSEEYSSKMKDGEQTIFNMISGMSALLYLSGRIENADSYNLKLIKEAVELYKKNREFIRNGYGFLPIGFERINNDKAFIATGIIDDKKTRALLSIWRLDTESDTIEIPLLKIQDVKIKQIYPTCFDKHADIQINNVNMTASIKFSKAYTAKYFEILY